jgi:uncharacterized membrane protein YqiK
MKNEVKQQHAKEIIEFLEEKGVADADKSKIFSQAYGMTRRKIAGKK